MKFFILLSPAGWGLLIMRETVDFFRSAQFGCWLMDAHGLSLLLASGGGSVGNWGLENRTEHLRFSNDRRIVTKFLPSKRWLSIPPPLPVWIRFPAFLSERSRFNLMVPSSRGRCHLVACYLA